MAAPTFNRSDYLVDILKQIQARKTVRPEDATKALQQYKKVQEQIKALKSEIEVFKKYQEEKEKQEALQKAQQQEQPPSPRRKSSHYGITNHYTPSPRVSSKSINSSPQTNGISNKGSTLTARSSASSLSDTKPAVNNKSNKQNKQQLPKQPQKQTDTTVNGNDGNEDNKDKDKEIARLRLQNAQLKVIADNRFGKRDSTVNRESETTPKENVSEPMIPTTEQLVQDFKTIHDVEYRAAFKDLETHYKLHEENITELLAAIAKEAFTFCQAISRQQYEDLTKAHTYVIDVLVQPKYASMVTKDVISAKTKSVMNKEDYQATRRYMKEYRRRMARVPIPGYTEIFENIVQRDILSRLSSLRSIPKSVKPYIHRLVEVNWFMSVHEPPMFQVWPRCGQLMNRNFVAYGKTGATIIHTVWPALYINKEGNIAGRGICLVK